MTLDLSPETEALATRTVDQLFQVYRGIGAGCPESVYHRAFARLLERESVRFRHEVWIDVEFLGLRVEHALRADFIIDNAIVVELKAHPEIHPAHEAQLLTYLRWSGHPVGFLMNFGAPWFRQGIRRYVRKPEPSRLRVFEPSRPRMREEEAEGAGSTTPSQ